MAASKLPPYFFGILAQRICNLDPDLYEQLIKGLETHADELTVAVTDAAPDRIFIVQGQAQNARKLLQLLKERHDPKKP